MAEKETCFLFIIWERRKKYLKQVGEGVRGRALMRRGEGGALMVAGKNKTVP